MVGSDQLIQNAMNQAKELGISKAGDLAVIVQGTLEANAGNSNLMKVLQIS